MAVWIDRLYAWAIRERKLVLQMFLAFDILLVVVLVIGGISVYTSDENAVRFRNIGLLSAKSAIVVFALTLVPGIMRRLGWKHKLISLLRIYRRYTGVLMFFLVMVHASLVSIVPRLPSWPRFARFAEFELWGIAALTVLACMFATSNDKSIAYLKIWWYRLHRLVYAVMFFVLMHTALQGLSTWSVIAGSLVVVMAVSFGVDYLRRKKAATPEPLPSETH